MTQLLPQLRKAGLILAASALISIPFTSCSSGLDGTETLTFLEDDKGFASVATFQAVARVTAINPATRKLGLLTSDGKRERIRCGPEVVNFDQIKVNDLIEYTLLQKSAVFVGDRKAGLQGDSVTSLARIGDKPGINSAETMSATAVIKEVNTSTRKVTLELGDGSQRIITTDKDFDLSKIKVGKSVTLEYTEVISLVVKAPQ
jgi:Cu/Ag efflux protein CusF